MARFSQKDSNPFHPRSNSAAWSRRSSTPVSNALPPSVHEADLNNTADVISPTLSLSVVQVVKQCCATDGVEPPYIKAEILPPFFKHFWNHRMALDRRNYRQLVDTTVEIANKVSEAVARVELNFFLEYFVFTPISENTLLPKLRHMFCICSSTLLSFNRASASGCQGSVETNRIFLERNSQPQFYAVAAIPQFHSIQG